jgi:hypothetical protein
MCLVVVAVILAGGLHVQLRQPFVDSNQDPGSCILGGTQVNVSVQAKDTNSHLVCNNAQRVMMNAGQFHSRQ